ncbi:MAG: PEP-CTERM sorting domain-containing protein [Planctomycetota bacterium]
METSTVSAETVRLDIDGFLRNLEGTGRPWSAYVEFDSSAEPINPIESDDLLASYTPDLVTGYGFSYEGVDYAGQIDSVSTIFTSIPRSAFGSFAFDSKFSIAGEVTPINADEDNLVVEPSFRITFLRFTNNSDDIVFDSPDIFHLLDNIEQFELGFGSDSEIAVRFPSTPDGFVLGSSIVNAQVNTVPEPTTAGLLGIGGLMLFSRRRKQVRSRAKATILSTKAALAASLLAIPAAAGTFSVEHSGIFFTGSGTTGGGDYTTVFTFEESAVDDLVITEDEITSFTATTTNGGDDAGEFLGFAYDSSNSTLDFAFISLNLVSTNVYEVDDEIVFSETFYSIVANDDSRSINLGLLLDFNEPRSTFEDASLAGNDGFFREGPDGSWTQIVVPEPASLTLLSIAGMSLIVRRRRS